jgi:hypothetical protein
MSAWEQFKKGFDSWEDSTAKVLERVLKSPSFVGPSGGLLSAYMRARAKNEDKLEASEAKLAKAPKGGAREKSA